MTVITLNMENLIGPLDDIGQDLVIQKESGGQASIINY